MRHALIQYVSVLAVLVVVDAAWLGLVMRRFYADQLGPLLRDPVWWPPAVGFYLVYAGAITILVLAPADRSGSLATAVGLGAVLGLAAYATYDLSNLATLKGFPVAFALVDIAWGTVLTAVAAGAGWWIAGRFAG